MTCATRLQLHLLRSDINIVLSHYRYFGAWYDEIDLFTEVKHRVPKAREDVIGDITFA
jgi:hypothetical protein